jgi:hypothetical protein
MVAEVCALWQERSPKLPSHADSPKHRPTAVRAPSESTLSAALPASIAWLPLKRCLLPLLMSSPACVPPSSRPAPNAAAVMGDLRVSSQALRLMGQDPLPAALAQAGGARSTRKGTRAAAAEAAREAGGADGGGQGAIPEEGEAAEEPSPATLAERAAARGKAKVSLMDRQEGARTLQVRGSRIGR